MMPVKDRDSSSSSSRRQQTTTAVRRLTIVPEPASRDTTQYQPEYRLAEPRRTIFIWSSLFTLTAGAASGALVGSFFGLEGAVVGGVSGALLGTLNEVGKIRRRIRRM